MSNRAPDFSSAFDIVDDKLADAEKRLAEKRRAAAQNAAAKAKADETPNDEVVSAEVEANVEVKPEIEAKPSKSKLPKKRAKKEEGRPELQLVSKEHRRNLTLKVLEENEQKFNELFFKLQLKGDGRKKQDLADEALELLFGKYNSVLEAS